MAEFLGDIAVCVGILLAVIGLVLLHRASAPDGTAFLKSAGWLALAVGIGSAVCTASYMLKYRAQGDFDAAYPPMLMGKPMDMSMMKDMKMMKDMMGGGMQKPAGAESNAPADTEEHESHHPDKKP